MNFKKPALNIIFWSVVSAAFIGPGTITTASKSGALFGTRLLWTLVLATFACYVLQESASRITILSGKNIGQAIREKLFSTPTGKIIASLTGFSIYIGAVAYEMGNLIGAREGISLLLRSETWLVILVIGLVSGLILSIPSLKIIARIMGFMVMILGISFLIVAIKQAPTISELVRGMFIPDIPGGKEAPYLILGLAGTTIVPYNLFLGSQIAGQSASISEMRSGLLVSVILGGIFSMAVMVAGTGISGEFSFSALAGTLESGNNLTGKLLLGTGLFAAGFTSGITAPLAAAITLQSIFGTKNKTGWSNSGIYFRLSWIIVLLAGLFFALLNIKPVPAIILAQALNGLILPMVSFFIAWLINTPALTGTKNSKLNNILTGITLSLVLTIGIRNVITAFEKILDLDITGNPLTLPLILVFSIIFTILFIIKVSSEKRNVKI